MPNNNTFANLKFHHIGVACEDIDTMVSFFTHFFDVEEVSPTIYDKTQGANLKMITLKEGVKYELISGNIVDNFCKRKDYLYHTCYEVDNLESAVSFLRNEGFGFISDPVEAVLFQNRKVIFLHGKLGMIELLER